MPIERPPKNRRGRKEGRKDDQLRMGEVPDRKHTFFHNLTYKDLREASNDLGNRLGNLLAQALLYHLK